ncbi:putative short chain dehydrogenase/ reductase [Pyrenochaeta sp. MPI-SDFR-AT-0127]|nr:putative short chain dehydrogenase/ reductase [Pyrenochaeta sp. MPI-SDFR-AT-0127]
MTALSIAEEDIPRLENKVAIITGKHFRCRLDPISGIGLAAARILMARGAHVHVLDLHPIDEDFDTHFTPVPAAGNSPRKSSDQKLDEQGSITFRECNVADWKSLQQAFNDIGHVDIAIANAGVSQDTDYFADTFDKDGQLEEPRYDVMNVNLRAALNFVKLSISAFRRQGPGGSIVLTASATAFAPEQSLSVYSALKLSVIGLVRALRPSIQHLCGATINAVAPAATVSKLLPADLAGPIIAAGAPVSNAHHVGLAIVFSAVAHQLGQVEAYGRDSPDKVASPGRWNGRVILTLGDRWTEVEEPIARLRPQWLGEWNAEKTIFQQRLTDMRP